MSWLFLTFQILSDQMAQILTVKHVIKCFYHFTISLCEKSIFELCSYDTVWPPF